MCTGRLTFTTEYFLVAAGSGAALLAIKKNIHVCLISFIFISAGNYFNMGSWTRHFLAKAVEFVKSDIFTNVMVEVFFF